MAQNINGREEDKIKTEQKIQNILKNYPQYLTLWYLSINGLSHTTKLSYINTVRLFLDYLKDNGNNIDDFGSFSRANALMFFGAHEYTDNNGKKKSMSVSRKKTIYIVLNKFFTWCIGMDYIQKNPCETIQRPVGHDNHKQVYLNQEEIREVMDNMIDAKADAVNRKAKKAQWITRDIAIVATFLTTGIRETALTEINMEDVTYVYDGSGNVEQIMLLVIDKENKMFRKYLTGGMVQYMLDWIDTRNKIVPDMKDTGALFISTHRQRISAKDIPYVVQKWVKVDGKHVTPHKLRATYGTMLYTKTKDIYFVQKQMGHASPQTTERYVVDDNTDKTEAATMMNSLVFGR